MAITPDDQAVEGQLTGGTVADSTMADTLTAEIAGCYVVEDMGYDGDDHRREPCANNNAPVIPGRKNRKRAIGYDKVIDRWRRRIELFFGTLKENRRLAVRYAKTGLAFLGFIALAARKIYLC